MSSIGHAVLVVLFWATLLGLIFNSARKNTDPGIFLLKWGVTAILVVVMTKEILPLIVGPFPSIFSSTANAKEASRATVIMGMLLMAFCSVILGVMWAASWTTIALKPFTSAFDGGDEEVEAQPVYSKAKLLRGRGQFRGAITEIRQQLEQYPNDFSGQMLLAEIEAENLKDLQGASAVIQRIVNQPKRTPAQISGALNAMADWHLKYGQDPDSARLSLEQIAELLPDSPFSQAASQRIAHLASVDQLVATHARPTIALKSFERNIGAQLRPALEVKPPSDDPAEQASRYVQHLQQHPLDAEARQNLATIYAEHYQRIDLAAVELEQLISQSNHAPKQIVHWLNLLADFQVRLGNDVAAAEKTVRRITELFPDTAHATQANTRLQLLRLECKRNEKSQAVKLGSYEKDLGLKKITG